MKTAKMTFDSVKDPDGWMELAHELKFDAFKKEHPELDEDEISSKFYTEIVSERFSYGEYGSFEIIVDENFNIVGGRIF